MNKKILLGAIIILVLIIGLVLLLPKQDPLFLDKDTEKEDSIELKRFNSEEEILLAFQNSENRMNGVFTMDGMVRTTAEATQDVSAGTSETSHSQTNVQVHGVDEADIVKTDGEYIYILRNLRNNWNVRAEGDTELIIVSAYPDSEIISKTSYNNINGIEMFIDDGKVIIFANSFKEYDLKEYENIETEEYSTGEVVDYGEEEPEDQEIIDPSLNPIIDIGYYLPRLQTTVIKIINVEDKTNPFTEKKIESEGMYVSSRKIEDNVYFILNSFPKYHYGIERTECKDLVPLYRETTDGVEKEMEPILPCNRIGYMLPLQAEQFLTIIGVSLSNLEVDKEVILGSGHSVYSSRENLYVTYTVWPWYYQTPEENYQKTVILKFGLDQGKINFKTTGEVKGRVLNQFSMDEYNGYFRLATTFNESFWGIMPRLPVVEPRIDVDEPEDLIIDENVIDYEENEVEDYIEIIESPVIDPTIPTTENLIFVLDENLEVVGTIEGIAPGERIYSARFMQDKAYIITFVEVDPLFVIDLKDPYNPEILGELKIPGYSSYLHPYSENYLIGIGKEVLEVPEKMDTWPGFVWEQGLKLSLFDVTDLENPIELYKEVIGDRGTFSNALFDHKSFLFDKEKDLLIIPISVYEYAKPPENVWEYGVFKYQGMFVYSITPEEGFNLKGTIAHQDSFENRWSDFYSSREVLRSLYINNVLYTLSNSLLKLNELSSLEFIKEIDLN